MTNRKLQLYMRCHHHRWPWMTLNCNKFEFCWNFADFGGKTAERMKIDTYCQRQRCNPLNVPFSDV